MQGINDSINRRSFLKAVMAPLLFPVGENAAKQRIDKKG